LGSADEAFDGSYPTNVVLTSEGGCTYIPPGIFKSTCKIDITWFPFDDQDCEMKFGSWTYDGGKVSSNIKYILSSQANGNLILIDKTIFNLWLPNYCKQILISKVKLSLHYCGHKTSFSTIVNKEILIIFLIE
jgi:Neurotransmitter-gated ion-channel ligand binding domain